MFNFSKKLLALALSTILIISLIPASVFTALAVEPQDCAESPLLTLDTPTDVSYVGTEVSGAFRFVSETDETYMFYSSGDEDTYCDVMDENGNIFVSDDDTGGNGNFKLKFEAAAGKTYYLLSRLYYSNSSGSYTVTLKKYESPIDRVEVKSIDVVKDLSGYEDWDSDSQAFFHYQYSNPEYTVYFKDGSEPLTTSYSTYVDGQYYSLEYKDDQYENHWTDLGAYEVPFTFAGYKSTFTVNVVQNPVARVVIEPVTVIDRQGGYETYDWNTGENYYYYNYLAPKYTVYFKDGTHTENDASDKQIFGDYYSLNRNDNQRNVHWTVGNTYTVSCTFAGVDCSYTVSVVEVPVTAVEIEDVVLTENFGGRLYNEGTDDEYFNYDINRPVYTVYYADTQTETNSYDKTIYGNTYSLEYNIDQYSQHFLPGQTYEIPCTFMGFPCSFNITVNPSPVDRVVFEEINLIENFDGYESGYGDDQYFRYRYDSPEFTVYFNDGTEPKKSSYGSINYNGKYLYLNYSDTQYNNHFALGENKVPCTFAGKKYEFTVNVIENPVSSVEFEGVTVYENMGGYIATDGSGNEYYRYNFQEPVYTLHFKDGTSSETNRESKEVNGNYYYLNYADNQDEEHWTVGNTYHVNYTFMNIPGTFDVKVEPNPVLSVEVDPITVIAGMNCYERIDREGNPFDYYYFDSPQYVVHFRNGEQSEKTDGYTEVNGYDYSLRINFDQYTTHLEAGHIYNIPCTFGDIETSFVLTVKSSPITRIVFEETSVIENASGSWTYDGNDQRYFQYEYRLPSYTAYFDDGTNSGKISGTLKYDGNTYYPQYGNDDQYENHWTVGNTYQIPVTVLGFKTTFPVTVKKTPVEEVVVDKVVLLENTKGSTDTDGNGNEYYRYNYSPQYSVRLDNGITTNKTSYSTKIGDDYFNLEYYDSQYEAHWTVGNTYDVPFTFAGYSGTFQVEVKENPVDHVVIEPAEVIENIDGEWDTDAGGNKYFHYDDYSLVYTVYFKNGTHTATNSYNKTINGESYWLTIYDDQNQNHWSLGGTYNLKCEFMNTETTATFTVVKNPVASIAVGDITVIENTGGSYKTDKNGNRYYEYYSFDPQYTVTFDNGKTSPTISGSYKIGNSYHQLRIDADQSETHWTVGNTYTVPCTFMGVPGSFRVTIAENPIASITVEDTAIIENGSGYFSTDKNGRRYFNYSNFSPKYYVTYKDGTTSPGNSGGIKVGDNWYYLEYTTDQYENHWSVGNTYEVDCSFLGVQSKFNVSVVQNPIKSIKVTNLSLIENSNGYMNNYGERYFVYRYNPEFDVTYLDGRTETGLTGSVQIGDTSYSLNCNDTQDENHWTVGNTYEVTATLAGVETTFNVAITPTPVASVEIEDVTLIENSNGWTNTDDNSIEFFEYDYSPRYKVTFKDGTTTELSDDGKLVDGKYYGLNNYIDDQYENHWTVGKTYNVTASFLGVEGTFKVTITNSPVKSIEVDDVTVIENIGTWIANDASGVRYNRYPYPTPNYKVTFYDGTSTAKDSRGKEVQGQMYWLEYQDDQNETHWTVGNTYTVNCEFLGAKSTFKVTVKPISYFTIPAVKLNVPKAISYDGSILSGLVKFVPTATATYKFYSTGQYYTDGFLYNSSGEQIEEGFGGMDDRNFSFEATLTAGSTYYLLTQPFDGIQAADGTCNFNVCVTKSDEPLTCTHSETETRNAVAATCTTSGFSGDIYCKACGEKLASGSIVSALGHTGGVATCHSKAVCTRCGVEYGEYNPNNHDGETEVRGETDSTCTVAGYTGDTYCLSCNKKIADGTDKPLAAHTSGDWQSDEQNHWKVCSVCTNEVDMAPHTESDWIIDTEAGIETAGQKHKECTVCGRILAQEVIPAHEHIPGEAVNENIKDATCTEEGSYDIVVYCTVCGGVITRTPKVISKLDHNYKSVVTAPTCTEGGYTTNTCVYCGESTVTDRTDAAGHKPAEAVIENEKAATYTADGSYDEVVYCSVCNAEISRKTVPVPMKVGTFKITYNLNGGKNNSANPASFKSNAAVTLKAPTRTGYKFEGWYKDSAFSSKITTISKGTAKNVTVYAKWSAVTYKLTYKLNGGKNGKNPASFKVTTATITLKNPTRAGYKFGGWFTDSKFKNKITKITKGTAKNITLYAKWSVITYKLTYKLNGGKNAKNPKSYKVTTSTIKLKNPTKKGYTFKGWYSDSKFKKKVTKIAKGSTGNKTLYAKWAKKK